MLYVYGKHGNAQIMTNNCEQAAIDQIQKVCDNIISEESIIRVMPDVHAGKGCTIGTTMTFTDKIVPNLVGVDIGCGMTFAKLLEREIDFDKLDAAIRGFVPSGPNIRKVTHPNRFKMQFTKLNCIDEINLSRAEMSIGTLGGGNHFIEVAKSSKTDDLYLIVHSGSRHLGKEVCDYYQKLAVKNMENEKRDMMHEIIECLKYTGETSKIQEELSECRKNFCNDPELAYLAGDVALDYIWDVGIVQDYASLNRKTILEVIRDCVGLHFESMNETIHNYVDIKEDIIRKGAVSAQKGEQLLIPMNMRDGSLLCVGKGNPEWNYSAPHGAGRLMSRTKAISDLSMDEYKKSMDGIFTTSVNKTTLDEAPMAYKPMDEIMEAIKDTVDVIDILKPVYNFKAS